jgi:hypothetical protein
MTINSLDAPSGQEEPEPTRPGDAQSARPSYRFTGQPPSALSGLLSSPIWVAWDYRLRNGKWTKPPFSPHDGSLAKVSDPGTWSTFDDAVAGMQRYGFTGVGIVVTQDVGMTGIDLDHCINDSGSLSNLAAEIIATGETYAEISPSGKGIRIFARGAMQTALTDRALGVEVYGDGRYLTVTGNHVADTPTKIRPAPQTLALLKAAVEAKRGALSPPKASGHHVTVGGDFFGRVNSTALASLDTWVPRLHPTARAWAGP